MKKILILLIAVLGLVLISAPAMAAGIPGDSNNDRTLSKGEMSSYVLSYLSGNVKLDDARDAAYVYSNWNGNPKSIIDSANRTVTLYRPADKIVVLGSYRIEAIKIMGEKDRIIAIDTYTKSGYSQYYPELRGLPNAGTCAKPDYEAIIAMQPDLVITTANANYIADAGEKLGKFDIPVVGFEFYKHHLIDTEMRKLGDLLDSEDGAEKFISWKAGRQKVITDYLNSHPDEYRPTFYVEMEMGGTLTGGKGSNEQTLCDIAGGRNIAENLGEYSTVDIEYILKQNPEIIVYEKSVTGQWGWKNSSEPEKLMTMIEERPGWSEMSAMKNNKVYVTSTEIMFGPDSIAGLAYFAKWMHPDVPIDPEQVYAEYLKTFLDIQYPEGITMVYPEQ